MPIVTNKKGGKVVVRGTSNTTVTLDSLKKDNGETVDAATLTQLWVSCGAAGGVQYYRANTTDANNLCFRVGPEANWADFAGNGVKIDEDLKDQQIIFVVPDGASVFVAEFHKSSTYVSEY
jgi:hypothetical protein